MTTDITELAQSLKRRAASANEFGESLYVKADNVLAVVEALEKAQRRITQLESRTVTVKQGEVLVTVAGFTGCGKSAIAGEIEIALKAIGVSVTWVNGDAEKRMTGADWLTAIEMYKPTVRIVEVNIPRAAGIKWEAE
uniref:ead/Ea22-like family protein n=1 Tax=Klebsiella sp. TaxID=576 RepID=UPI0039779B3D